jgi:hypothetical protein
MKSVKPIRPSVRREDDTSRARLSSRARTRGASLRVESLEERTMLSADATAAWAIVSSPKAASVSPLFSSIISDSSPGGPGSHTNAAASPADDDSHPPIHVGAKSDVLAAGGAVARPADDDSHPPIHVGAKSDVLAGGGAVAPPADDDGPPPIHVGGKIGVVSPVLAIRVVHR